MMEYDVYLTTVDNPFNPAENFLEWYNYDRMHLHHHPCETLAAVLRQSDQFTEAENAEELEKACDRVVQLDFTNTFVKLKVPKNN